MQVNLIEIGNADIEAIAYEGEYYYKLRSISDSYGFAFQTVRNKIEDENLVAWKPEKKRGTAAFYANATALEEALSFYEKKDKNVREFKQNLESLV